MKDLKIKLKNIVYLTVRDSKQQLFATTNCSVIIILRRRAEPWMISLLLKQNCQVFPAESIPQTVHGAAAARRLPSASPAPRPTGRRLPDCGANPGATLLAAARGQRAQAAARVPAELPDAGAERHCRAARLWLPRFMPLPPLGKVPAVASHA